MSSQASPGPVHRDEGMYCSTCGASIPEGRRSCETCGSPAPRSDALAHTAYERNGEGPQVRLGTLRTCPRCDYQGQGLPYFTRGPNMAALIGATLFTLPWALGAGGIVYYGMRREHRVCPRCGAGWGRLGERALDRLARPMPLVERRPAPVGPSEGLKRAWSIILFALGAIMATVGAVELEAVLLVVGVLSAVGGVLLHRAANVAREERRAAMLAAMQRPVLKLAAERAGRLTVTQVAAELDWPLRRAEKVLHSLDDGWRVSSEVTDEGVIVYEFREIMLGPGRSTEENDRLSS